MLEIRTLVIGYAIKPTQLGSPLLLSFLPFHQNLIGEPQRPASLRRVPIDWSCHTQITGLFQGFQVLYKGRIIFSPIGFAISRLWRLGRFNKDFYKIESIRKSYQCAIVVVNVHIWKKIRLSLIRYSSLIYVKK